MIIDFSNWALDTTGAEIRLTIQRCYLALWIGIEYKQHLQLIHKSSKS